MRTLSLGVYVIGVTDGKVCNAFAASSVMPVSLDPVMLAACVGRQHASHSMMCSGPGFTVNVLRSDQLELARHFGKSSRELDKLRSIRWRAASNGAPILEDTLAYFECTLHGTLLSGDHEVVVGRVCAGNLLVPGSPLAYSATDNLDGAAQRYGPIPRG
jgi:flavin reductase (DIM6/NTAB) family NADH-FMN oxidoreductase RutF